MKQIEDERKNPSLDEFMTMDLNKKIDLFLKFTLPVQKVLISLSAYPDGTGQLLLNAIRNQKAWTPDEFDGAIKSLLNTPYFVEYDDPQSKTEPKTKRYKIADPMKNFICIDLKAYWEKQKTKHDTIIL